MRDAKISVIVPVYKVEPYLRTCLDSIRKQTYQNLEVLLVDDGSPDHCGEICEEYARIDSRFRVIHRPNGGVSAARNTGLEAATGDWVGWVDPDDWIEEDMFELLVTEGERAGEPVDVVICGGYEEYRRRQVSFGWPCRQELSRKEALFGLLEDRYMHNALYDKLWKRSLYEGIRFPEGHTYEDLAVIYRLYEKADHVLCLPDRKYHYRQHSHGIMGDSSLSNRLDHCLAARGRCEDMMSCWPEWEGMLEGRCITAAIGVWCGYYCNPKEERQKYLPQLKKMAEDAKKKMWTVQKDTSRGLAGRMVIRLLPYATWWSFGLAWGIGRLYRLRHDRSL